MRNLEGFSNGSLDVLKKVKDYIPNIGSGYAEATVQQVLNMDLENNYSEDYSDPLSTSFEHETSLGWRLPSENTNEQSQKEFPVSYTHLTLPTNREV